MHCRIFPVVAFQFVVARVAGASHLGIPFRSYVLISMSIDASGVSAVSASDDVGWQG